MKKFVIVCLCALTLLLSPALIRAAAISPSIVELTSSPGETVESSFTILNTGVSEQTYFIDLLAFEPSEEDGTPVFTSGEISENSFLSWMKFPIREVSVPELSKVDVPFSIVVPDDIPAGSYYGAMTVSTAPTEIVAANGAIIEAKTAILVFLTVRGETTEKLELLDFMIEQTDSTLPFGILRYRVQNQGNVHLIPEGEVKLTGLFGQEIASLNANESKGRVLPSSTRTYEIPFGSKDVRWLDRAGYQLKHLLFGPVTAQLTLTYGQTGSLTSQTTIWVIPVELLAILGSGMLVVLLLFHKLKKQ
ncbi:MAG: hypothetical protein NUV84_02325 [Candidatus Uhrbacteria bacterium]|nr:hypothetical protein [Candidatus Uhrbacteria bacterium]